MSGPVLFGDRERRSCYSKKRYTDEKSAKRVAGLCYEKRGARLRSYPCFECGGYHLTSQAKKDGPHARG